MRRFVRSSVLLVVVFLTCAVSASAQDPCQALQPPPPIPVGITLGSEIIGTGVLRGTVEVFDLCGRGGNIIIRTCSDGGCISPTFVLIFPGATSGVLTLGAGRHSATPVPVVVTALWPGNASNPPVSVTTNFTIQPLVPTITFDRAEAVGGTFVRATVSFNDSEGAFVLLESSAPAALAPLGGNEFGVFFIDSNATIDVQVSDVEQPTPVTLKATVVNDIFGFSQAASRSATLTVCPPAGCSPNMRVIAERLDGTTRQVITVPSGAAGGTLVPPAVFFLGEQFALRVVEVNADGSDGQQVDASVQLGAQSVAAPSMQSAIFTQPTKLFPNHTLLHFTASSPTAQFLPVHSGQGQIVVSIPGPAGPREVTVVTVVPTCPATGSCGFTLGTTRNQFDDDIIRFADLRGIPPQIFKALVLREAGPTFNPNAYRYEPLTIDYRRNFVASNPPRLDPSFAPYVFRTLPDTTDAGLPQGQSLQGGSAFVNGGPSAIPREAYFVSTGNPSCPQPNSVPANCPLREFLGNSPGPLSPRRITSSDEFVSMENTLYSNPQLRWTATPGGLRWQNHFQTLRRLDPLQGVSPLLPFTAQTSISASYGLTQMLYVTAVEDVSFVELNGNGKPPHLMFEPVVSLDLGSEYLGTLFGRIQILRPLMSSPVFLDFADLRYKFGLPLKRYNGLSVTEAALRAGCNLQTGTMDPDLDYPCAIIVSASAFAPVR